MNSFRPSIQQNCSSSNWARAAGICIYVVCLLYLVEEASAETAPAESTSAPVQSPSSDTGVQPLSDAESEMLLNRFTGAMYVDEDFGKVITKEYAHRDIIPYLTKLINDEKTPQRTVVSAMWVLAGSGDSRGISVLKAVIDRPLKQNMSYDEWHILHNAILCLGRLAYADDATLDLLEEMATENYWIARNPAACQNNDTPESFRHHMRLMALDSFAASGSDRAITLFKSKKDLPPDMLPECDWLFNSAVRHRNEREPGYKAPQQEGNTEK